MHFFSRLILVLICVQFFTAQVFAQKSNQQVQNWNTKQPSRFTENKGQVAGQNGELRNDVKYVYSAPGFQAIFKANSFSYEVFTVEKRPKSQEISEATGKTIDENLIPDKFKKPEDITINSSMIDIELPGANMNPRIIAEGKSSNYNNYYLAHTPKDGIQKVYNYTKLIYKNIWPNIDLVFYAMKEGELKYDIVVRPGGKLKDVSLHYNGNLATNLENRKLKISTATGYFEEEIPLSYYSKTRKTTKIFYKKGKSNTITFSGNHDNRQTLIIDPILKWNTYFGGNIDEIGYAVSVNKFGYIYIGGYTGSKSDVATSGVYQSQHSQGAGYLDAFVAKFDSAGNRIWCSYFGGRNEDYGKTITTDVFGNVFLAGYTSSYDMIPSNDGHQQNLGGGEDAFLAKFDDNGARKWATFYGGAANDDASSLTTDTLGNVYMAGGTESTTAISTAGAYQTTVDRNDDGFLVKFDSTGVRVWGTYFGGPYTDYCTAVTADFKGNIYLAGYTASISSIATPGAYQDSIASSQDAYFVKFDTNGKRQFGTYFGGNGFEYVRGISTDALGNVYLGGYTSGTTGIASSNAFQKLNNGGEDAFLAKFDSTGRKIWSTYFGSISRDLAWAVVTDDKGNSFLAGYTESKSGIATHTAYQDTLHGSKFGHSTDAYLAAFDSSGNRVWSTYLGGERIDWAYGVAVDKNHNVYITGYTYSNSDFATKNAFQQHLDSSGANDAFLARFDFTAPDAGIISINDLSDTYCDTFLRVPFSVNIKNFSPNIKIDSVQIGWSVNGGINHSVKNIAIWANDTTGAIKIDSVNFTAGKNILKVWTFLPNDEKDQITQNDTFFKTVELYESPRAIFSVNDICVSDSLQLADFSEQANFWFWKFGDGNTSKDKNPKYKYKYGGKYDIWLIVSNANGCKDSVMTTITVDSSCVWPGDANGDKIVNHYDILAIGIANSYFGSPRADTSTEWKGMFASNWSNRFKTNVNYKHADCNGDGGVDSNDTLAISRNYTKTHAKKEQTNRGKNTDPLLKVEIQNDSLKAGDTLVAYIILGENALPAKDVYGIAFSLAYDENSFTAPVVDFTGSWLGIGGIPYSKRSNGLDIAITRTDQKNISGAGKIAIIRLVLKKNVQLGKALELGITDNILISANEQQVPVNVEDDSVQVYKEANSIYTTGKIQQPSINIYPNPFSGKTTIEFELVQPGKVGITLYDISGRSQLLMPSTMQLAVKHQFVLDAEKFKIASGIHSIRIEIDGKPYHYRIVKVE